MSAYNAEDLAALVEQDRQRRAEEFRRIIEEAAARLRVQIVPIVTISGNQVASEVRIVSL